MREKVKVTYSVIKVNNIHTCTTCVSRVTQMTMRSVLVVTIIMTNMPLMIAMGIGSMIRMAVTLEAVTVWRLYGVDVAGRRRRWMATAAGSREIGMTVVAMVTIPGLSVCTGTRMLAFVCML